MRLGILSFACFVALLGGQPCALPTQEAELPGAVAHTMPALEEPELTEEARESLELLRFLLEEEGPEAARQFLREVVEALGERRPNEAGPSITYLLELDRLAKELASLSELKLLREKVLAARQQSLPEDHSLVLIAKEALSLAMNELGDLDGALELQEAVYQARVRLLPPDHPELLRAMLNLAGSKGEHGDLEGARKLEEAVHDAWTRLLPPDDPSLLMAKQNLAVTRAALGDLEGARELREFVLAARSRLLPPDHPQLLMAMEGMGNARRALGDVVGALEFFERVLEGRIRTLPPDHKDLIGARLNLAATLLALGELQRAHDLFVSVVEAWTRVFHDEHPLVLMAKDGLAGTKLALGDLEGARELEMPVVAARTRLLSPDHPDLLQSMQILGATMFELGELEEASKLFEVVLGTDRRLLAPGHPNLIRAEINLAVIKARLGDLAGARKLAVELLAGMRLRSSALRSEAPRLAREGAWSVLALLFEVLALSQALGAGHVVDADLFATLEEIRLTSVAGAETAHAIGSSPELTLEVQAIVDVRSRINDLVATGSVDTPGSQNWRAEFLRLTEERDRLERSVRKQLSGSGVLVGEVDAKSVAAHLVAGTALASFVRYPRPIDDGPVLESQSRTTDAILAFLVTSDGAVRRIELGSAKELEALVGDWRASIVKPLSGSSGTSIGDRTETELGRALRMKVIDPLLVASGEELHALHVVLDDILFLVPLDALSMEDGVPLGDRIEIHSEPTLARILSERRATPKGGHLVALGGVDFEAVAKDESTEEDSGASGRTTVNASWPLERAGKPEAFQPLAQTGREVELVGARFAEAFESEPVLLLGAAASKSAFRASSSTARFLHVATHGWFASEAVESQLDHLAPESARPFFQRAEGGLAGFAPETLCGLALAGANRGKDALGRVPGILTAEELASFDLRNCELAVLSACETNVGIRRAGQGIQSLQSALHAAGARTAITSLWRVDDAATQRLFELFYDKLWREKLGKHEALWQAKMALRAERHPTRNWAGWVLSGDPD